MQINIINHRTNALERPAKKAKGPAKASKSSSEARPSVPKSKPAKETPPNQLKYYSGNEKAVVKAFRHFVCAHLALDNAFPSEEIRDKHCEVSWDMAITKCEKDEEEIELELNANLKDMVRELV